VDKTTRRSIDVVLAEAQARLRRLSPFDALAAVSEGWTLVDTRVGDVKTGSSASVAMATRRASPRSACTSSVSPRRRMWSEASARGSRRVFPWSD